LLPPFRPPIVEMDSTQHGTSRLCRFATSSNPAVHFDSAIHTQTEDKMMKERLLYSESIHLAQEFFAFRTGDGRGGSESPIMALQSKNLQDRMFLQNNRV